jgi:hypothetical protein
MNKTVQGSCYDHLLAPSQHLPREAAKTHENAMIIFWQSVKPGKYYKTLVLPSTLQHLVKQ